MTKKPAGNKPEKPLITADKLVAPKNKRLKPLQLTKAILSFIPVMGMSDRFCQKGGRALHMSHYWNSWVRDDGTILAGPIFGGPLCSVILEELAALGVKYVIGYGYSGVLDPEIPTCSIMVADAGFCSDGTSKEYSDESEAIADPGMLKSALDLARKCGIEPITGKVWTTDAIYREFPSKVSHWRKRGARFVNLETGSLYAVARETGLKAVYLSVVSDDVSGDEWSGWHPDWEQPIEEVWNICLEMAEAIAADGSGSN